MPRTVQPAGTTTVVSYSSTSSGPGFGAAPIEVRDRTGTSSAVPPSHMRRVAFRSRTSAIGDVERRRGGRGAERREPQRADLDRRARLAAHAVEPLVLVLEPRSERREQLPVDRALGQLDLDLPALPAVAELGGAHPVGLGAAGERPHQHRLQLVEARGDRRRVDGVDVEMARADLVELGPREQQPDRAEEARERRDENGRGAELLGEPARVHRTGAAVGDQREVARVATLLRRDRAQRPGHAGVRDPVDPVGRLEHRQPERRRRRAPPPPPRALAGS